MITYSPKQVQDRSCYESGVPSMHILEDRSKSYLTACVLHQRYSLNPQRQTGRASSSAGLPPPPPSSATGTRSRSWDSRLRVPMSKTDTSRQVRLVIGLGKIHTGKSSFAWPHGGTLHYCKAQGSIQDEVDLHSLLKSPQTSTVRSKGKASKVN